MTLDDSILKDNPNPNSLVYANGLRNPFGEAWRKNDRKLYVSDNGPEVDDRIAKIEPGGNYGWPESMRKKGDILVAFHSSTTAIDFMQDGQFPKNFMMNYLLLRSGLAYQEGWSTKGKKIVKLRLSEDGNSV